MSSDDTTQVILRRSPSVMLVPGRLVWHPRTSIKKMAAAVRGPKPSDRMVIPGWAYDALAAEGWT